jgi:zinc D-Ala-D-Ala carboxypeptidase
MANKRRFLTIIIAIAVITASIFLLQKTVFTPEKPVSIGQTKEQDNTYTQPQPEQIEAFNKGQYSITEPSSLWVLVNKQRPLPASYAPADLNDRLREPAHQALNELFRDAKQAGIDLKIISGYRSYATQQNLYQAYIDKDGQAQADTYSARPGHSEHQTGLATDVGNSNGSCDLEICFGESPAGKWLAQNAHIYGFIIRYQNDKTDITGYQYEPWHLRFVGKDLAKEIHKTNQTLEEFFNTGPAPRY